MKTPTTRRPAPFQAKASSAAVAQADNRASTIAQRQTQASIEASPRQVAQR